MDISEAVSSDTVVKTTQEIIKADLNSEKHTLKKSGFVNSRFNEDTWQLFM